MKTKLLKKVRKRFSIDYYPNGYKYYKKGCETIIDKPCIVITDYSLLNQIFSTPFRVFEIGEGVAYDAIYKKAYKFLLDNILHYYESCGTRRKKQEEDKYKVHKKLWYDDSADKRRKYELQQAMKSWDA